MNAARQAAGKRPATNVWLWGLGQAPRLRAFVDEYGPRGAMITAVDLLRGIAALVGWDRIEVPGATGYLDTDYAAKGRAGVEALKKYDIVCVHVEASDEASHEGRGDEKVKAIEEIDRHVVGPLLEALNIRTAIGGSWSRPTTRHSCAPKSTRTATYRWRWRERASRPTNSQATAIRTRRSRSWRSTRDGS